MKPVLLAAIFAGACLGEPRIVFSKSFPGSTPAFVRVTVEKNGAVEYVEALDDPQPLRFDLNAADVSAIFDLAAKLNYFERPLESNLPVAKMGEKTLRWEDGAKNAEVKFNYSTDPDAQAELDWFEKIVETEQHRIMLERTVKFDKLGVNKAILQLQAAYERKRILAPEQFLKLLDRVAKNESYLNMARERAALLADTFRNPKAATAKQ